MLKYVDENSIIPGYLLGIIIRTKRLCAINSNDSGYQDTI